jgi:hypothetical protein
MFPGLTVREHLRLAGPGVEDDKRDAHHPVV